jgi:hypothetical protein
MMKMTKRLTIMETVMRVARKEKIPGESENKVATCSEMR